MGAAGDGCAFVSAAADADNATDPAVTGSSVAALGAGTFRVTLNGTWLLGRAFRSFPFHFSAGT